MNKRFLAAGCLAALFLLARPAAAQVDTRLVGVWQAQAATPVGPVHSQLILQPNGSYTQQTADANGHMTRAWGTWFTPAAGTLRLGVEGYAPTVYRGTPMAPPPSELVPYRFLDSNRIQTNTGVIYFRNQ